MKIAIAINASWNIYNFRQGIIKYYLSKGWEVLALAPNDDYTDKLRKLGCSFREVPMVGSGMNPINDLLLLRKFYKVLKEEQPDVMLTYTIKPNIFGSIASGLLGMPNICNVSGLGTVFLWKGWLRVLATGLYGFAFRYSKWVFFQNSDDRRDFLKAVRLRESKTSLLPGSGINLAHFEKQENLVDKSPTFVMIARLLIDKGVYEFVEAVRIFKENGGKGEFLLVGEQDSGHGRSIDVNRIQRWEEEELLQYQGEVEDVRPYIANAEVVVLPSYREGTPRTLLEGAAMGRALIATDVPGCREVVEHGKNGFLCDVKNPLDLAEKLMAYTLLPTETKRGMQDYARKKIEKEFSEDLVIEKYAQKVEELIGSQT